MRIKNKNIFFGVIISYFNVLISIIYGFISVPVLVSALGKSEYGVYSTIASLIGYMSIMDFGIHNVLVRYLAVYKARKDRKAYENLLAVALVIYSFIAVIMLLIGYGIYLNLDMLFKDSFLPSEITVAKQLFWVVLMDLIISLPGAIFQCVINAEEHFIFGRTVLGVKQILKLVLLIGVVNLGGRSLALVWAVFLLNMTVIICQAIYCYRKIKIRIHLHNWTWNYIYSLFAYTFFVFVASVSEQITWKLDSIILGMRISAEVVAVYSVAMNLITIYRKFSGAVSGIFLPKATRLSISEKSEEASTDLMIRVGTMQLLILSLILVGFAIIGEEFVFVWIGQGYEEVYPIFMVLGLALLIPNCQSIGINILEARNKHQFRAVVYCCLAIVNGVSTYFVVGRFGMIGAAMCTAVAVLTGQCVIINIYYKRVIHLDIKRFFAETFGHFCLPISAAAILSYIIIHNLHCFGTWISLISKGTIIVVVYVLVIFMTSWKKLIKTLYHGR